MTASTVELNNKNIRNNSVTASSTIFDSFEFYLLKKFPYVYHCFHGKYY